MKKRFSVIIATYNREELVCQTIDSVLAQTFKDYEIIVADDGSTDGTADKLRLKYGNHIQLVSQANQGSARAYQFGASFSNGEYLVFLDSDDLFFPYTLATYDKIIQALNSPQVILGSMLYFRDVKEIKPTTGAIDVIEVLKYRDYLSKDVSIGLAQSRIVLQKRVFDEINRAGVGTSWPYRLNDYNLMLLVGTYGPCVITVRPITVAYRQHEAQASKTVEKQSQGLLKLIGRVRGNTDSGRQRRRYIKYVYLGGPVMEWSIKALKSRRYRLALRLIINGWPMVTAAALRKLRVRFRRTGTRIVLPYE